MLRRLREQPSRSIRGRQYQPASHFETPLTRLLNVRAVNAPRPALSPHLPLTNKSFDAISAPAVISTAATPIAQLKAP